MKLANRIILCAGCLVLLLLSWLIAINAKSTVQIQLELMDKAAALTKDGIYTLAAPLLEEAAGYTTEITPMAESELKKVYLSLIGKKGYRYKYTDLLEKQMSRKDAKPEVFAEAARYYLGASSIPEALDVLKAGIKKTGSDELTALYELNRYCYETGRDIYENAAEIFDSTAQVCIDGLWGIAKADGTPMIPCMYERISTFSADRAIVQNEGEIFAIDKDSNRIAKLHENATAFGNYSHDRIAILLHGGWRRSTGEFAIGSAIFEYIGTYSDGYAAAKFDGRWGVVDLALEWLVPAEYDAIIMDELGRSCSNSAVFARQNGAVTLLVNGEQTGGAFEDAHPFMGGEYAAVKKNGKWGFIDMTGMLIIDYQFDDARSFGQHLAAIEQDGLWGYISIYGDIAIEPIFLEAKSFSNGSAPVLTHRGWQFITLLEYKTSGPGLFS